MYMSIVFSVQVLHFDIFERSKYFTHQIISKHQRFSSLQPAYISDNKWRSAAPSAIISLDTPKVVHTLSGYSKVIWNKNCRRRKFNINTLPTVLDADLLFKFWGRSSGVLFMLGLYQHETFGFRPCKRLILGSFTCR